MTCIKAVPLACGKGSPLYMHYILSRESSPLIGALVLMAYSSYSVYAGKRGKGHTVQARLREWQAGHAKGKLCEG